MEERGEVKEKEKVISFSVLMSIYKGDNPAYLRESLESIANQTLLPNEVVLVLDGPVGENLENVIANYQQRYKNKFLIKIVRLNENKGLGEALRIGLKHCTNEIVARMDADDVSLPNRFETQIDYLLKKNLDIVGSYIDEYDENLRKKIATRKVPTAHRNIVRLSRYRNPFNHMTVIFRKKSVERAGSYIPLLYFEDYYLWLRVIKGGARCGNVPIPLVKARTGRSMLKRRSGIKYLRSELKFLIRAYRERLIGIHHLLLNLMLRIPLRLIPLWLLEKVYYNFLRR